MTTTDQPQPGQGHPVQPLLKDSQGTVRFKVNRIVRYLLDTHPTCNLNMLACMDFSDDDRQQFAQLIGYSLSGYGSLSYVSDANYEAAEASMPAAIAAELENLQS